MKGTCPVCAGLFQVTKAGELRIHGKPANRCPGSGSDPAPTFLVGPDGSQPCAFCEGGVYVVTTIEPPAEGPCPYCDGTGYVRSPDAR